MSVKGICKKYEIPYFFVDNPNGKEIAHWIRNNSIDILIIMVSNVIKEPLLSSPKLGIINKHAALLPANMGLFPYIWATIKNQKQGVSFHLVVGKIDSGNLLYQEILLNESSASMVRFYSYIFKNYHKMCLRAVENLINKKYSTCDLYSQSYHGMPRKEDYDTFYKCGGKIIEIRDIPLALTL